MPLHTVENPTMSLLYSCIGRIPQSLLKPTVTVSVADLVSKGCYQIGFHFEISTSLYELDL